MHRLLVLMVLVGAFGCVGQDLPRGDLVVESDPPLNKAPVLRTGTRNAQIIKFSLTATREDVEILSLPVSFWAPLEIASVTHPIFKSFRLLSHQGSTVQGPVDLMAEQWEDGRFVFVLSDPFFVRSGQTLELFLVVDLVDFLLNVPPEFRGEELSIALGHLDTGRLFESTDLVKRAPDSKALPDMVFVENDEAIYASFALAP